MSIVGFKNRVTSLYLLLLLHNKLLQNLVASDNCKHLTSLTKLLSAYLDSSSLDYLMRLQSFESLTGTGGFISKALVPWHLRLSAYPYPHLCCPPLSLSSGLPSEPMIQKQSRSTVSLRSSFERDTASLSQHPTDHIVQHLSAWKYVRMCLLSQVQLIVTW